MENKKRNFIIFSILAIAFIWLITWFSITIVEKNCEIQNAKIQYEQEMSSKNSTLNKQKNRADCMNVILNKISTYMPIAASYHYRDSICSKLLHSTGDIVRMKPDSSKWVIIAISISGGKWHHSVNYILKDSSGKKIEVEPEIIY